MNTLTKSKSTINPRSILGGIPGLFEEDFERESSSVSITQTIGGVFEDIFSLGQDIAGINDEKKSNGTAKFPPTGSIDFNKNAYAEQLQQQAEKQKVDKKRVFFRALKEDQERALRTKEKILFEEEINDISTNLPTDQKNELLHYQASYQDRSTYQRAELRKKLIEQRKQQKQEIEAKPIAPQKFKVRENDLINSEAHGWKTNPG